MNRPLLRLIPNGLSASRVVLGVAFPWLPPDWRFAVIGLAAATDFLDGLLARWLRAQSETGRLLDPVADKVFVLMLAGTLVGEGALDPGWALAVAVRDVVVLAGIGVVAARGTRAGFRAMRPTWLGKCTTAAQFALFLVLAATGRPWDWLLWLTAGLSAVAAAGYVRAFRPIRRGERPPGA